MAAAIATAALPERAAAVENDLTASTAPAWVTSSQGLFDPCFARTENRSSVVGHRTAVRSVRVSQNQDWQFAGDLFAIFSLDRTRPFRE
jgi:hypothetical protein